MNVFFIFFLPLVTRCRRDGWWMFFSNPLQSYKYFQKYATIYRIFPTFSQVKSLLFKTRNIIIRGSGSGKQVEN